MQGERRKKGGRKEIDVQSTKAPCHSAGLFVNSDTAFMPSHLDRLPPSPLHQPSHRLKAHNMTSGLNKWGLWRQWGVDGDVRKTAEWTDAEPLFDNQCEVHPAVSDSTAMINAVSESSTDFKT